MLKVDLYNTKGEKKDSVSISKEYDVIPNMRLLTQAVHVYEDRGHFGLARAKTRSEVAISTKKIYKQKGTGGARHGAKSAPIFVGGGVTHGPKGIKRILHLSKSQRNKALLYAVSYKISESKLVLADAIGNIKKTKEAGNLIKNILKDKNWKAGNSVVVALARTNSDAFLSFRNIKGVTVDYFKNLNAYTIFVASGLIIEKEALEEKNEKQKEVKETVQVNTKNEVKKIVKNINKKKIGKVAKSTTVKSAVKAKKIKK